MKNGNGKKIGSRISLYKKDLSLRSIKIVQIFILTFAIIVETFMLPMLTEAATKFTISNAGDLLKFAADVNNGNSYTNCTVVLDRSIDMTNQTWSGIGTENISFAGAFDGNNNIITNLGVTINNSTSCASNGLFTNNRGNIQNVGLTNVNIIGKSNNVYIGGICGRNYGNIRNCFVKSGIITGSSQFVGGIIGKSSGSTSVASNITNCFNGANITSTFAAEPRSNGVGGVAGLFAAGTLENCYNTGNISSNTSKAGILI